MGASIADLATPLHWGDTLAGQPVLDCLIPGALPALIRRWRGIPPAIEQSALDQHFISIHLSGAKRLHRSGEGQNLVCDAPSGAHSIVPAGSAYRWMTEGPVDFMHIYFDPLTVAQFAAGNFDDGRHRAILHDSLGSTDRLIDGLATALIAEASADYLQQAYVDDLMHLLMFQVLRQHSDVAVRRAPSRHALPPFRLRRALDFIEAHLAQPIGVSEIAGAAGMSAFHFSRAFRNAVGTPPYAYLLDRRIAAAKTFLSDPTRSVDAVARRCGFGGSGQFSRMFKRATGMSPGDYRNRR